MSTKLDPLQRAIALVGGQSELARRLSAITGRNIKQGHIHYWMQNGLAAEVVRAVAESTEWEVTPHELDGALYPNRNDALPPERAVA